MQRLVFISGIWNLTLGASLLVSATRSHRDLLFDRM